MQQTIPTLLTDRDSSASKARKELLARYLSGNIVQQPESPRTIMRRGLDELPQLSFSQERLWFLDQLNPGSSVFNVPLAVRLTGPINKAALERSINEILRRHEALRTAFSTTDGRPSATISADVRIDLPSIDLTWLPKAERENSAARLLSELSSRPFDLVRGPLIRSALARLDEECHIFLVVLHHIVSDGWSLVIFFRELSAIYTAFCRGEESPLPDLAVQYADYARWQRQWLNNGVLEKQLSYWREQLSGELPALSLPIDKPRPAVQTYNGAREWLILPQHMTEELLSLGRREGVTLFMTLLAAFNVLLHLYSGQEDIIVGSPIANRPQVETEVMIGFFLNNLALRSDLSGNPSFREMLARVRKTSLEAYAHQDVPFEKLIDALKPERDLSRTPVFQVYFNLFNFAEDIQLPGSSETISFVDAWGQSDEELSKFDLTLYAGLQEQRLKLALVYNTDLFNSASIKLMLEHFECLLKSVVANPEIRIEDFPLQFVTDARQVSAESKRIRPVNAFVEFEKSEIEQSIAARFARQVEIYPDRIAIKSRNFEWTYQELAVAVESIARFISRTRGDNEERIALLFDHDAPMIAGMLGCLMAGKTYVPLDPHHPRERLAQIVEHSQSSVILTNDKNVFLASKLKKSDVEVINIDRAISSNSRKELAAVELAEIEPDRLAYILYTSGSTGQPKGVMQNHRNVLHYIRVYTNNLHLGASDRLSLFSSYCFDASVMDIFGALLNGATLYPYDIREDGLSDLSQQLIADQITVYHSTPTVYRYFVNTIHEHARFPHLRLIVLGGEKVNASDVESYQKHFPDDCIFVNGLGPTEATVALQNFIGKKTNFAGGSVPVGFPVEDTEVVLLNRAGKESAVAGEIAIRSEHVAMGYWDNAEATARAFTLSPAESIDNTKRVYRTGDMGRRLPDGSIRFEGRKDFQVKVRGFRVELGEIESALAQHPKVREGVVIANENFTGETQLMAYVVLDQPQLSLSTELRAYLRERLPEYMVPASFVVVESLPLTPSGKLNRRALSAPNVQGRRQTKEQAPVIRAPQTPLEKMIARIWVELLGVNTIGLNDNFFELGGHSLMAVRLFSQIEKRLGKRLPLATLFQAPTIRQLAVILQRDWTSPWTSLVPIQPAGSHPPFFCVHALGGNVLEYYELARHLGDDQPFYGFQSIGLDGRRPPHTCLKDMAAHYLREMRELQPDGPYFIGGRSLGGMIAFEMAQQLRAQGQEVGLLALLDTYPSGYAKLFRDEATLTAAVRRSLRRVLAHLTNLRSLSHRERLSYVVGKARFAPRKFKSQVWRRVYSSYDRLGRSLPRILKDIEELNSMAVREYAPQPYDGRITLFWAHEDLRSCVDLVEGWRSLAGGIEVYEIPGTHLDIVKEPHVQELASKLRSCLKRAQAIVRAA